MQCQSARLPTTTDRNGGGAPIAAALLQSLNARREVILCI